jgi:hypothetical protein
VLVLVANYPVLNILLTSFIFVCACHEIHAVTAQLMTYFVPSGKTQCCGSGSTF